MKDRDRWRAVFDTRHCSSELMIHQMADFTLKIGRKRTCQTYVHVDAHESTVKPDTHHCRQWLARESEKHKGETERRGGGAAQLSSGP